MSDANPRQLWDVKISMRDNVQLSANVHLPSAGVVGGPYPALIERNCYTNQLNEASYTRFTDHGYAVVLQDVRGRNDSEGDYWPIHQEHEDGYDTIEWVAEQPWCDGRVGSIGASYMGWTQWATASRRPPHLRAMFVVAPAGLFGEQEPFDHGVLLLPILAWLNLTGAKALQSAATVDWRRVYDHLPIRTMDEALGRSLPRWREWLAHPVLDDYWKSALVTDYADMDIPTVVATGWWDSNLKAGVTLHRSMVAAGHANQHLIVGPWDHANIGEMTSFGPVEFGADAHIDLIAEQLNWFDRWLKDASADEPAAPSRVFVTGLNRWRHDPAWPPLHEPRTYYLHSDGNAGNSSGWIDEAAPQAEPPDVYRYDPQNPVVVAAGDWNFYPYAARTGLAATSVADGNLAPEADPLARPDILVYLSTIFETGATAVGVPEVVLFACSDGPDTDWFVAIDDLFPDERVLPLSTGQLRARFRNSLEREEALIPGQVTEHRFPLRPIAHSFEAGHRMRVTITSSRFPIADRNPNTGAPIDADDAATRVATNTIHHSSGAASHVVLPIVGA